MSELSPAEIQLLKTVTAYAGTAEPRDLSQRLGVSRQRVAAMVKPLRERGFLTVTRLTKMTCYEITSSGRECLEELNIL